MFPSLSAKACSAPRNRKAETPHPGKRARKCPSAAEREKDRNSAQLACKSNPSPDRIAANSSASFEARSGRGKAQMRAGHKLQNETLPHLPWQARLTAIDIFRPGDLHPPAFARE